MLKCTTKTSVHVNYRDLDNFVNELFGIKTFEFVAEHEANNDSAYTFSVSATDEGGTYSALNQVQEWIDHGHKGSFCGIHHILCYMAIHGHIEPGEYIVEVSW